MSLAGPESASAAALDGRAACEHLEEGRLLFFPQMPFEMPPDELQFLRKQKQSNARCHKNISYFPATDRLKGYGGPEADAQHLRAVMQSYSQKSVEFLGRLLAPYRQNWRVDVTTFRPLQEKGRKLRLKSRNDLVHVDSFPSRPTHGDRILRIFTNINPTEPRQWVTGAPFGEVVRELAGSPELPLPQAPGTSIWHRASRGLRRLGRAAGMPIVLRSPYDAFMRRLHHHMKANQAFQNRCEKRPVSFPPGSCWVVYTDLVPHAALYGQYALEQTLMVRHDAMVRPECSPLSVLERMAGAKLTGAM
jgi:hypothetical protein